MRTIFTGLLLLLAAAATPARAGEERSCTGFERLARNAAKVFVARVHGVERHDDERGKFKIVEVEVVEGLKGAVAGERLRVLVFDGVVHGGDPEAEGKEAPVLLYLSPLPAKSGFLKYGSGLFLPAGGDASIVTLADEDASEILAAARAALHGPGSVETLLAQLDSGSERVRANAMASLVGASAQVLKPAALQLASRLAAPQATPELQASLLQALAKAGAVESLDPLLRFALDEPGAEELLPLAAEAMNRIDAAESVRRLEVRVPVSATGSPRAMSLLSRLDSPTAIRGLLERARAQRTAGANGGLTLTLEPSIQDPVGLLASHSIEERKAAAYQMLRWGSPEQKRLVRDEAKRNADPAFRRFLEKLLREPYRPFAELQ